ncbi:histidine kinase N-terminal 7TM domain-containing protein [Halovenus halobia]|uniref:histidine kinase N-terminal 7TM domain-containing protein n=1 Tax=Halovenus halobia TaxID=3396622 RepID=UPI003F550903
MSAATCLFSLSLAAFGAVRYRDQTSSLEVPAFIALMAALAVTEFGVAMTYLFLTPEIQLFWANIVNSVGLFGTGYALLWFALAYAGHERFINRWTLGFVALHMIVNVITVVLAPEFLYEARGLMTLGPVTVAGVTVEQWQFLDRTLKLSFRIFQLYMYSLVVVSSVILVRYILQTKSRLAGGQILVLLFGIGVPVGYNTLLFAGITTPAVNFTTQSLVVMSGAFAVAVFRYRLLEPAPVGRRHLVEMMDDPVVMVDSDGRVVDCNPAARALVDAPDQWRGLNAERFFRPLSDEMAWTDGGLPTATELILDDERSLDVQVSHIHGDEALSLGCVVVFRDTTEQNRRRRRLEQKNEQLDQFRSVLSHDLRNPLNVASGNVALLRDEYDDARLDTVAGALERMEQIVEETLQLARHGTRVTDPEPVALGPLVEDCWAMVEADGATLDQHDSPTVLGDPDQLRTLFENLLRNAVEHNDPPLTIRVGTLLVGPWINDFIYGWLYGLEWISLDELRDRSPASAAVIEEVTAEYDYETPKIGYIDDRNPNAFTYGSGRYNARIVLTEGCFEFLDDEETASVMAHELGHITSRDFIIMTIANTIVQLLYLVAVYAWRIASTSGSAKNRAASALYAVGVLAYIFWFCRRRRGQKLHQLQRTHRRRGAGATRTRDSRGPVPTLDVFARVAANSDRVLGLE